MRKILVIEDETRTGNLSLNCLKSEGFYIIGAENRLIGVQRTQEQLPDLVLCDVVMLQLNGYGVLTTLRQDIVTAIIPFILLTAKGTKAELRQVMKLAASNYPTEPPKAEEILGANSTELEKQKVLRQWHAAESQRVPEPQIADTTKATPKSIFPSISSLKAVFDFIEANYHRPITLSTVAEAVGYSPAYLTNLVRQQTGQSLYRWIIHRRMIQAYFLILETDQKINEISEKLGYQNVTSFRRQFRQLYGRSPQNLRSEAAAIFTQYEQLQND